MIKVPRLFWAGLRFGIGQSSHSFVVLSKNKVIDYSFTIICYSVTFSLSHNLN